MINKITDKLFCKFSKFNSIKLKFAVPIIFLSALILIINGSLRFIGELISINRNFNEQSQVISELAALTLVDPVWNFNTEAILGNMDAIFKNKEVSFINVKVLGKTDKVYKKINKHHFNNKDVITLKKAITKDKAVIGYIEIGITKYYRNLETKKRLIFYISNPVILILILWITIFWISSKVTKPLEDLSKNVKEITGGNYNKRIDIVSNDEIGVFAMEFNIMADNLCEHVFELKEKDALQELIMESTENGYILYNNDGEIILTNNTFFEMLGLPEEAKNTVQISEMRRFVTEQMKEPQLFFNDTIRNFRTLDKEKNVYELENKNGESIFKIKCHPISDPSLPKGIYNMIIVVFSEANKENGLSIHDISIHQNYSPMNFLMKEALQIAEIGFYCMNRDHIYLDCNPWTCHFVGAKFPEEVKGRNIFELAKVYDWPQHVAQEIYHVDEGIMAIGIPRFNIPTILPQGPNLPPVYQYNTKYPIFNRQGKVTGLVGAVSDSQFQFFKSN